MAIESLEIRATRREATADHLVGDVMAALSNAAGDARDRSVRIRQREEEQCDVPARIASCDDAPEVGTAGERRLEGEVSARAMQPSISSSITRPARTAAAFGANGDRPAAIRSALTKRGQCASSGRKARAKVVLPAPFGPAMIRTRRSLIETFSVSARLPTTSAI